MPLHSRAAAAVTAIQREYNERKTKEDGRKRWGAYRSDLVMRRARLPKLTENYTRTRLLLSSKNVRARNRRMSLNGGTGKIEMQPFLIL